MKRASEMGDEFSRFHPIVNFIYFSLVLAFSMTIIHPACQIISLVCAAAYAVRLCGSKGSGFCLKYSLPIIVLTAVINPAFNHAGCTILTYLPTGNPLTLESILYGISSGCMLAAVLIWFMCFSEVITSDKFIYLFGKISPSLSLLLSMTLRFVPKFKEHFKIVSDAQRCLGRDVSEGSVFQRLKNAVTVFSIMITWSLENAIETADSMKSRGYGLKGRTAFSIYIFDERDRLTSAWLIFCGFFVFCGQISGVVYWKYLPFISYADISPLSFCVYSAYFLLCITPVLADIPEDIKWKKLK